MCDGLDGQPGAVRHPARVVGAHARDVFDRNGDDMLSLTEFRDIPARVTFGGEMQ